MAFLHRVKLANPSRVEMPEPEQLFHADLNHFSPGHRAHPPLEPHLVPSQQIDCCDLGAYAALDG